MFSFILKGKAINCKLTKYVKANNIILISAGNNKAI